MSHVNALAAYLGSISYRDAPEAVRERVRTVILYNLAMALGGYDPDDAMDGAFRAIHAAPGKSTLLATGEGRSAADAAFINAALITARGQNDTFPDLVAHGGCIVIPAALAIAEERGITSADALSGILAGYEAIAKIGVHSAAAANARGFRASPVFGVFGSAAAVARALRLDPARTASALSIAANFAGGLLQCWADGTSEWRIQIAQASAAGLRAALYAEQGIDGGPRSLDGPNGFHRAFAGAVPDLAIEGWDIMKIAFKPYPGCAFNQAPVHTLRLMLKDMRLPPGAIERVTVTMNPADATYPGVPAHGPFETPAGAIMSCPFMIAATLRDGAPARRHFSDGFADAALLDLAAKVEVLSDPAIGRWHCRVEARLAGKQTVTRSFDDNRAFLLGWNEMIDLLAPVFDDWLTANRRKRASALIQAVDTLQNAGGTEELLAACRLAG